MNSLEIFILIFSRPLDSNEAWILLLLQYLHHSQLRNTQMRFVSNFFLHALQRKSYGRVSRTTVSYGISVMCLEENYGQNWSVLPCNMLRKFHIPILFFDYIRRLASKLLQLFNRSQCSFSQCETAVLAGDY